MAAIGPDLREKRPGRAHVVDAGLGNLRSVTNALAAVGAIPVVVGDARDLDGTARVVLPGVGSFGDGIANLRAGGWIEAIERIVERGIPLLGICLGMQLLMTEGSEHGRHRGLNLVEGEVALLRPASAAHRVPHIGWNDIEPVRACPLMTGIADLDFYFAHSYAVEPKDRGVVTSSCDHGGQFVATIQRDNVFGVQFHPEKSHRSGLRVLRNFMDVMTDGEC